MVLCHIERGKSVYVSQEKVVQAKKSTSLLEYIKIL